MASPLETVLVVGSGGREHALAASLAASSKVAHVLVCPGNGGTARAGGKVRNVVVPDGHPSHEAALCALAKERGAGLVVVGPEVPLVAGLADQLRAAGVACFGPGAAAAQLEGSKAFSKAFMARHGVPTAAFRTFEGAGARAGAVAYVAGCGHDVVIKASGLAAGKGVVLPASPAEAAALAGEMCDRHGTVVVEERLAGMEVSCLVFCDGTERYAMMPLSQDHKRAADLDRGLNTGGMGAFCPVPGVSAADRAAIEERLVRPTVAGLAAEGLLFVGCLYIGVMLTAAGPMVLEYNCRFGDPETQVVLPLLESDLAEVALSCALGRLEPAAVSWAAGRYAAAVVAASHGYPAAYAKGKAITGLDAAAASSAGARVFHAGTRASAGGGAGLETSGGRVLAVAGVGPTLEAAVACAYGGLRHIRFEGLTHRTDIGAKQFAPVRLAVLGSTRGTDLQPILDAIAAGRLRARVTHVVSNRQSAYILQRARDHGVPATHIASKGKSREQFDTEVLAALEADPAEAPELVLLIGFMRILSPVLVQAYAGRMLNVHPSLLPKFAGGMDTNVHQAVLDAGEAESGCTVHQVTQDVDSGAIAVQRACAVAPGETVDSLKAKVQALEGDALIQAVHMFQRDQLPGCTRSAPGGGVTYADAGVDIDKGNAFVEKIKPYTAQTRRPGADGSLGGFGAIFDLAAAGYGGDAKDSPDRPMLISATDGVGTKLRVAQTAGKHSTIGIDLVAMCVNDLIVQNAEPLFFLDYFASGRLDVEDAADVVKGIAQACVEVGCALSGGETAEMPGMYQPGHYDLAGFSVGAVTPAQLLPRKDSMRPGDVLIGLPSSGLHSNGFSLVRHVVAEAGLDMLGPCPFESPHARLCDALLEPTKLYVKQCLKVMRLGLVHGAVHVTGGGFIDNVPRVLPPHLGARLDMAHWAVPPVFQWLVGQGGVAPAEALRTFNCGIGMILIVPADKAEAAVQALASVQQIASVIGHLVDFEHGRAPAQQDDRVVIENISFAPRTGTGSGGGDPTPADDDKPKEECGVFGVFTTDREYKANTTLFYGLYALQHRGQEGAGIVTVDADGSDLFHVHRGMGLVPAVFSDVNIRDLRGCMGIGHSRYSTAGGSTLTNSQPFVLNTLHGCFALCHNGQIAKGASMRRDLMKNGVGLFTESDSEVLVQYLAQLPEDLDAAADDKKPHWEKRIQKLMRDTSGAYSVVFMTRDALYAFRDPLGIRPLSLGMDTSANGKPVYFVSSESCAIGTVGAKLIRDIKPGEIVRISEDGIESFSGVPQLAQPPKPASCIFELVYFARPDSVIWGRLVHQTRQQLGVQLAKEHPCKGGDIVVGVPDSSTPIAIGFANEALIPFTEGLTKNRYIGRTFIQPDDQQRRRMINLKYRPLPDNVRGKSIVLVDDSLVRGNTIRGLATLLKDAGAREVHIRIASPPITDPCFMGIDMKTKEELVANQCSVEELCKLLNADSLHYLSHEGLIAAANATLQEGAEDAGHTTTFCSACFTGKYPLDIEQVGDIEDAVPQPAS